MRIRNSRRSGNIRAAGLVALLPLVALMLLLIARSGARGDGPAHLDPEVRTTDGATPEEEETEPLGLQPDAHRTQGHEAPATAAPVSSEESADAGRPPAGCIEVSVLDEHGGEGFASAFAVRLPTAYRGWPPFVPDQAEVQSSLDLDQRASLCGLSLGAYRVWVSNGDRLAYGTIGNISATHGSRPTIELGTATLHGHVLDWHQRPCPGAFIRVHRLEANSQVAETWTNSSGDYLVPRLWPGPIKVEVFLPDDPDYRPSYTRSIEVSDGEVRTEDFAPDPNQGVVEGFVQSVDGEAVRSAGRTALKLTFVHRVSKERVSTFADSSGAYRASLKLGEHAVFITPPGFDYPLEGEVRLRVDAIGKMINFTVPGATISGVAYEADRATPLKAGVNGSGVRFYREDRTWEMRVVTLLTDGRYKIYGLSPGTWLVSVSRNSLEAGMEVTIGKGDTNHELDVFAEK